MAKKIKKGKGRGSKLKGKVSTNQKKTPYDIGYATIHENLKRTPNNKSSGTSACPATSTKSIPTHVMNCVCNVTTSVPNHHLYCKISNLKIHSDTIPPNKIPSTCHKLTRRLGRKASSRTNFKWTRRLHQTPIRN